MNLQSSVDEIGEFVTQIIHFKGNVKRTLHGVISSKVKQGELTKLYLKDGRMVMINQANVLMVEVFKED